MMYFFTKVHINLFKKYKSVRTERDLNLDEIPSITDIKITKRMLLRIVNSCYDPLGLLVPPSANNNPNEDSIKTAV